jgi:hypothetical protein
VDDKYKEEKREYTIKPNSMEGEDYLKVLLCEDVLFINNGWWATEKGEWPKDHITVHVNCNDVFAWGCADAEDITYSELEDLYNMWKKDPNWGPAVWCIKKRKQMPQKPVEKLINDADIWNLKEILNEKTNS